MNEVYRFGPDACGEIVIRDDVICVIINDDATGPHNYVIRPEWHAFDVIGLQVDRTEEYVYDHIELIGDES